MRAGGAHRRTGHDLATADGVPDADRAWRRRYGDLVELLVLGDGLAAGLGARKPRQTLGGRLARSVGDRVERTVWLTTAARPGASGRDLGAQLDTLPPSYHPDVAVVVVGAEDVARHRPLADSLDALAATLGRLRGEGTEVVVGSCPASTARPDADGARWLARAQERVALDGGARAVSLTGLDGVPTDALEAAPGVLGAEPRGHKVVARALLPAVLAALRAHDAEVWSRETAAEAMVGSAGVRPHRTAGGPSLQG